MFCVRCGKEVGDELVESSGVCHPCYLEENKFTTVPTNVDFEVCHHCTARRRGEIWIAPNQPLDEAIHDAVKESAVIVRGAKDTNVTVTFEAEDERHYMCTVRATGVSEGVPFEEEYKTRARVKGGVCQRCSRFQGGYYEALLQIRATRRDLAKHELRAIRATASRLIERIVNEGDPLAYVLKDEEIHGGLDIFFGTTNAARMIAKGIVTEHGGVITDHAKMVGAKDGNTLYRVTFLLRLPEYRVNDLVRFGEDPPELVTAVSPKQATVRDVFTMKPRTVTADRMDRAVVYRVEEAKDAIIVNRGATEFDMLDPWTYATIPMRAPQDVPPTAETIPVIKVDGQLYPVSVALAE